MVPFFNDSVFKLVVLLDQTSDIIYRAVELEIAKHKVTLAQVKVMIIILQSDGDKGVTLADLSKLMLREPNSVSTLIKRMEQAGLVKKRRDTKENKIFVAITKQGRDLMVNKVTHESMDVTVSALTERERQKLRSYLIKLREKGRKVLGLDFKPPILR
jgi:DNA-binding MarR family transcriptional regulator